MNPILRLLGLTTTIISFLVLLATPSNVVAIKVEVDSEFSREEISPGVFHLRTRRVLDTQGNPLKTDTPYVMLPANKIEGLPSKANDIGLIAYNNTCPFQVALWEDGAVALRFKPTDSNGIIREMEEVSLEFDYHLGRYYCPELRKWKVDSDSGYVKTGGTNGPPKLRITETYYWFAIRWIDAINKSVYKIQACTDIGVGYASDITCKDVNLVTIQPDVMVLVIDRGVPLHVKFEKR